jgi:hypothetical protein
VARDGPKGLIRGNTNRRPPNAMDIGLKQRIVELSRSQSASVKTPFHREACHHWRDSDQSETVRRIRRVAEIVPKSPPRHRSSRTRKPGRELWSCDLAPSKGGSGSNMHMLSRLGHR